MKKIFINIIAVLSLLVVVIAVSPVAYAVDPSAPSAGKTDACAALAEIDPAKACGSGDTGINRVISSIINILSITVGIAAVIMIIVSGFKYITSGGDSSRIAGAKTTLIYALVGLAVAALAQVLVNFVFDVSTNTPCKYDASKTSGDPGCVAPAPKKTAPKKAAAPKSTAPAK